MVRLPRRTPLRRKLRRAPERHRRRKWPLAAAALLALALLWLWLPSSEQPAPPPAKPPRALPVKAAMLPMAPLRRRAPPPPRNEFPEREALLAAVKERSATLKACALPSDALSRLPLRLHVGKSGAMKSLDFTGEPPAHIASCVRKTAMGWSFDKIKLSSDVELLVAVTFEPGP
jgi:hypothetical protein